MSVVERHIETAVPTILDPRVVRNERCRIRLMRKVMITPDGCWRWTGEIDPNGYGRFYVAGKTTRSAHRLSYEIHVGSIPGGLQIDHLCHGADLSCDGGSACLHRACVNPAHLEAVTQQENIVRGRAVTHVAPTHCPQHHPYDEANTYWRKTLRGTPTRECRTCARAATARWRAREAIGVAA